MAYREKACAGFELLGHSHVAIVGLARNCARPLAANLLRVLDIGKLCYGWSFHVETNDNDDETVEVLEDFCREHPEATYRSSTLGRPHVPGEFAGRRTAALAEYREACQQWVREHARSSRYTIVVDLDLWAGWPHQALLAGVAWLNATPDAIGMASVSLFHVDGRWLHYDAWALRGVGQPGTLYDDYTRGEGQWKHHWLPPVGSEPVAVASAFGGLAVYRTECYLAGEYDGATDCEHATFHGSAARATGRRMYVCPAMRTVVSWQEAEDGG
jgi:hypothetical protein